MQRVIEQHHETIFSGHQCIKKTIEILKPRYYWATLIKDVEEYVQKCVSCNQHKTVRQAKAPLGKIHPVTEPFH